MINAKEAAQQTAEKVQSLTADLESKLQEVIDAAIKQGSCKTSFFPRNAFDSGKSVALLDSSGYGVKVISAQDQRDRDRIEISW